MEDLRLAWRSLRAAPIVSFVAVFSLALGIGANTAIFSLVHSLLLKRLPVTAPERLVALSTVHDEAQGRNAGFTYTAWDNIRQRAGATFDGMFAWSGPFTIRLTDGDGTDRAEGLFASGEFFPTLGVSAFAGRTFTAADDVPGLGADGAVAVISYGYWQRKFGGATSAIGSPLMIEGTPFTVIGVTPPAFFGVEVGTGFDVALPLNVEPIVRGKNSMMDDALMAMWLHVIGRLAPGQTADSATAALRAAQPAIRDAAMPQNFPALRDEFMKAPFAVVPAALGTSSLRRQYERPLLTLFIVVALVLLVCCANIANLLLARAAMRQHELSVRRALGAPRWRLARQLLVESVLLASAGALLGVIFAAWGSHALVSQLPSGQNVRLDVPLDWRVLGFAMAATVATALLFGTAPAFRASRAEPIDALKLQGRGTGADGGGIGGGAGRGGRLRLTHALVIAQVALSLLLVIAAGLFVQTFARLANVPLGFDQHHTLAITVDTSRSRTTVDDDGRIALYRQLADALAAVPGVEQAAGSMFAPFGGGGVIDVPNLDAVPERERKSALNVIAPHWFATYGLSLRGGRDFNVQDTRQSAPVLIVNEAFVRKFLPGKATALGEEVAISLGGRRMKTRTIVGVVSDAVHNSLKSAPPATLYLPVTQWDFPIPIMPWFQLNVRAAAAAGSPSSLTRSVTAAITALDRDLRLTPRIMKDQVGAAFAQERLIALLATFFGALALLLAALGLYGVTAHAVSRRRHEIGIRLGLGATPRDVVRLVLRRVTALVVTGIIIGAGASLWLSTFVAPLLFGLTPRDPLTLITAALTLAAVGAFAGWLPASRASRVDPAEVLRHT